MTMRGARHLAAVTTAVGDVLAKAVLVALLVLVMIDPTWGNLEGKAPVVRALTYPLWALAVPLVWLGRGRPALTRSPEWATAYQEPWATSSSPGWVPCPPVCSSVGCGAWSAPASSPDRAPSRLRRGSRTHW